MLLDILREVKEQKQGGEEEHEKPGEKSEAEGESEGQGEKPQGGVYVGDAYLGTIHEKRFKPGSLDNSRQGRGAGGSQKNPQNGSPGCAPDASRPA